MMASTNLQSLPKELLANIASFAKPSAVLSLDATCHNIRAACRDFLIFQNLLIASQSSYYRWNSGALDLDAIASRAGDDVTTWAQYAVANEIAEALSLHLPSDAGWAFNEGSHPLTIPRNYVSWLPELFVAKHPFMYDPCWNTAVLYRPDAKSSHIFCIAMTILASAEGMNDLLRVLYRDSSTWFYTNTDSSAFLWALCTIALWARTKIKQRLAAWPYNNAAIVPFIELPTAQQIPLRRLNAEYKLPAPFSRRPTELLGKLTSSYSAWDSWYQRHNYELFQSRTHLTEGTWCGYYIRYGTPQPVHVGIDAPMVDIQFEIEEGSAENVSNANEPALLHISAKDCVDGIGGFSLHGTAKYLQGDVRIYFSKTYQNGWVALDWNCRLTPFGIVGFLESMGVEQPIVRRSGIVWLWKKTWTEEAKANPSRRRSFSSNISEGSTETSEG